MEGLNEPLGVDHVRLFLDMAEVLGLRALVSKTLLVAVEHDIVGSDAAKNVFLPGEIDGLRDGFNGGSKLFTIHFPLFT